MMIVCAAILVFCGLIFLQKRSLFSIVFGLILLGNGINLGIFLGSKPKPAQFAFLDYEGLVNPSNDPLPQALVLTAIVIGFALVGFVAALILRLNAVIADMGSESLREEEDVQ